MCQTDKREKVEVRAVIKYLFKKGMSLEEIQENFMEHLGRSLLLIAQRRNGLLNLGVGREERGGGGGTIEEYERSRRPKEANTDENA